MPRKIRRRKIKNKLLSLPGNQGLGRSDLNAEQLLARRDEAFRLRVEEGLNYRAIAERLGISLTMAHQDVQHIAEMKYKGMIERDRMVLLENNAHYNRILEVWAPLLKPLMAGELLVGETKTSRGQDYDVLLPTYEAAKTATDMILKALAQREKLNGYHSTKSEGSPSQEALEGAGRAVFELMRNLASASPKKAEVIEVNTEISHGQ